MSSQEVTTDIRNATLNERRFIILGEKIGSGSYGAVYPAYDTETDLNCVVKLSQHKDFFRDEAKNLKLL